MSDERQQYHQLLISEARNIKDEVTVIRGFQETGLSFQDLMKIFHEVCGPANIVFVLSHQNNGKYVYALRKKGVKDTSHYINLLQSAIKNQK